jgi:hypothetical protein
MTWREECAPIIHGVLERTRGKPDKEIKAALRAAYPWGERSHHPYKIWLSEIKRQRKKRTVKQQPQQIQLL